MGKMNMVLIGLDKEFNMVGIVRYTNLQWRRSYTAPGTFAAEITQDSFNPDMAYVYCKDRPEVGRILQVNYKVNSAGYKYIYLSGTFLEGELNRMVVYPSGEYSFAVGADKFGTAEGTVEDVAFGFFNDFKKLTVSGVTSELDIAAGESLHRGPVVQVERGDGAYLGDKIYDVLALDEMSCRVEYDFVNNTKKLTAYKGRDLTQDNPYRNNPVTFSTRYGNCKNPDVMVSRRSYRNAAIITGDATLRYQTAKGTESVKKTYVQACWNRAEGEGIHDDTFQLIRPNLSLDDYKNNPDDMNGDVNKWLAANMNFAQNDLAVNYPVTFNLDFTAIPGSYEYLTDFDLGDLCSIEIPEIEISAEARLIGIQEVYKSGDQTLKLEFGTPILI